MGDQAANKQIQQMINFIKQEAEEKANEIRTKVLKKQTPHVSPLCQGRDKTKTRQDQMTHKTRQSQEKNQHTNRNTRQDSKDTAR
jgi:hypothetical protein